MFTWVHWKIRQRTTKTKGCKHFSIFSQTIREDFLKQKRKLLSLLGKQEKIIFPVKEEEENKIDHLKADDSCYSHKSTKLWLKLRWKLLSKRVFWVLEGTKKRTNDFSIALCGKNKFRKWEIQEKEEERWRHFNYSCISNGPRGWRWHQINRHVDLVRHIGTFFYDFKNLESKKIEDAH